MPRTTVLRRLTALIELGYLERVVNSYYLTAKSNVPNQRRVSLEHINNIQRAATIAPARQAMDVNRHSIVIYCA